MKRSRAILLVLVVLTALLAACTDGGTPDTSATPKATPTITSTPTVPDYSGVDFSGIWAVSALYDSSGATVAEDKLAEAGADFSLELLDGGTYFLYDADGKPLGQGQYSVELEEMILTAGGQKTTYDIEDADTLRCTAQDGSVTVMKRCTDVCETDGDAETSPEESDLEPSSTVTSEG